MASPPAFTNYHYTFLVNTKLIDDDCFDDEVDDFMCRILQL